MGEGAGRAVWSSKLAFVLSAAASAVGLGSMWRFPYLAAKYGGGTFLFMYLIFVFTIGLALLLLETALGRKTGMSAIKAFKSFGKKYAFIGIFTSVIPFIIVPYYCVIGGWVTKYIAAYATTPTSVIAGEEYFGSFMTNMPESTIFMLIFMALTVLVVARGVNAGIEKANLVMMPLLILFAIGLAIYALTMPGAIDGLAFYLVPDISKFSPELIVSALGQTFFTLSIAMGIMVTYGSYLDKKEKLTSSVVQIAGTTFAISLLAGLMIIPATFAALGSGEAVAQNAGPSLMFSILPQVFDSMGGMAGNVFGVIFFILVLFAALTSSISLVETGTSIIQDGAGYSRGKSLAIVTVFLVVVGFIVNLGYGGLSFIQPLGEGTSILDFLDFISNSVMMPIAAIMTCIFVGWIIKPKTIIDEVRQSAKFTLAPAWTVLIKYIAPVFIVIVLIAYVAQTFGFFTM